MTACDQTYAPTRDEPSDLRDAYGIKANPLRAKLNIPLVENGIIPHVRYDRGDKTNRFVIENAFPIGDETLHFAKWLIIDSATQKVSMETDWFRRKVKDSIFQHISITHIIKADTVYKRLGFITYVHNTNFYGYDEDYKPLDDHQIDSLARIWHLDYLVRGKGKSGSQ